MSMETRARVAIRVRFHGPTNTRGPRFVASCDGRSLTRSFSHAASNDAVQVLDVACDLFDRMFGEYSTADRERAVVGSLRSGTEYVVVFA